ncbi:MAG: hypothetical protein H3Z54_14260, partial [archaeon]|nr:hypothetical protein [archaeon]
SSFNNQNAIREGTSFLIGMDHVLILMNFRAIGIRGGIMMNLFSLVFTQGEIELSMIIEAFDLFESLERAKQISLNKHLQLKAIHQVFRGVPQELKGSGSQKKSDKYAPRMIKLKEG